MQNGLCHIFLNLIFKPNFKEEDISYINTKGTQCVPFCILPLCFILYSLLYNLYSIISTLVR